METMCATVLEISDNRLLVRDSRTDQEVVVNTSCRCDLRAGDRIRIIFNGAMTMSLPPQISADRICKVSGSNCR